MVECISILLCLLTLGVLSSSVIAIDVQNVTITGIIESHYALSGVVTVKFQDIWGYVCYYGSKKRWGKREATTACKQLGYTGGWPTMKNETRRSTHYLYNFDCDEYLEDLNYCEFDTTLICERSKVAGIQCYNSFQIELIDGSAPNVGRVQVKYDDVTSDVCYTQDDSSEWSFYNTQVLCRELGYPGSMFHTTTTEGVLIEKSQISGYQCKSDLRESSLQECNPDLPRFSENDKCSGVTVSCAAPGYVGCFDNKELTSEPKITNMTINECRHYCRDRVFRYAFLSRGDTCACSADVTGNTIGDKFCNSMCFGDSDQACGSDSTVSVYDVTQGICNDPRDLKKKYFFGEILPQECKKGVPTTNQNPIQCVLSKQTGKCIWNSIEVPNCSDNSDNNKDTNDTGLTSILLGALIIIGCCVLIAVCSLILYRVRNHRQRGNNDQDTHRSNDGCTDDIKMSNVAGSSNMPEKNVQQGYFHLTEKAAGVIELYKEITEDVSEIKDNVSAFFSSNFPKRAEKIIPIENHFGPAKEPDNQPQQDYTYRNRKYFNRKKKHKSEYNRVPDTDPDIFCKQNDDKNASGTDVDAPKSKTGGDKGDPEKSSQNTNENAYLSVSDAYGLHIYSH